MNYKLTIAMGFMTLLSDAIGVNVKVTKRLKNLKNLNSVSIWAGFACAIGSLFTSDIYSMILAVIFTMSLLTFLYVRLSAKHLKKVVGLVAKISSYLEVIATRTKGEDDYKELIFFYADIYHELLDIDTRLTPEAKQFIIKMQNALSTAIALIVKSELWKINRDDVVKLFKIDTSKCTEQDIDVLCNRIVQKFGLKEYYYD